MKDWLDLSRRDFLSALGALYGSAACAMAAPRSWFLEYATTEDTPARERFVNALCPMCPGGCGLVVRVVHGYAVGVRGNPNHPVNRGGLCARASAVLQDVYNPDRLREPLRAVGGKGSGRWEPIGWDAAIDLIVEKLGAVRARSPQAACAVLGRDRGLSKIAWSRFMRAFGSPNVIDLYPDDNLRSLPAVLATHGSTQRLGYDIAKAEYVLSFSSGWLEAHWSTEQAARAFGEFRRGRPGVRPNWIHIGPRFSLTGVKADEWIRCRPGAEGAVALGIAHVMIREGLYDRTFVSERSHGFEDWTDRQGLSHLGFRRMVLQEFSPTKVQAISGVPEGEIFRLAREFGMKRPAVALGYDGGGCGAPSTRDRMAVHCLNALSGSIEAEGGVTVFREIRLLDGDFKVDAVAAKGLESPRMDGTVRDRRLAQSAVDLLVDAMQSGLPYPTEVLFLVNADPVFALADGRKLESALSAVPFMVSFSAYHDNSNRFADLILPPPHALHRWDFDPCHTLTGHPVVTVSQPVMDPPEGMRDSYVVLRRIAEGLSASMLDALPWADGKQAVDSVCAELFEGATGAAFGSANEESWSQLLESRGWRAPFAADLKTFKRDVIEGGGWTDPDYFHREWDRVFKSPSGKFAFSSSILARSFEAYPETEDGEARDKLCLPNCEIEDNVPADSDALDLYIYPLSVLAGVACPNLPWLNDIAGAYMFEKWRTWVEIHPETAERFGLAGHDMVSVRTSRGELVLPVKIYSGLMPDVIAIPYGFGHKAGGRWCKGIGENPATLVEPHRDSLTGRSLWNRTRASIRKV